MELAKDKVAVWEEEIVIPTYPVGEPEKNPMFLERRVYQGSSGAVYPFPVIESVFEGKVDRNYHAVLLENEYLKVMILPELGGKIHMAYAKGIDYHFVYYNRVIKPALVGLAGPWVSGGIEFNWPQHHRPSTYSPVDYLLEYGDDGSATVWVGEIDRMRRTKASAGISLYPGRSYIHIDGRLSNPTWFPESFLWWANPAVAVNESYQSIFPPDVRAVFDHGKRDVSRFPIATGSYYKVDYSKGVDISWWKNIPVPTSYMAYHSDYDFVGGYDHAKGAGILHISDHHFSPGKKQWTWGNGDFGKAWERNLTDEDGPYIELMTGVFTDNQPDFSWLEPGEEKRFEQYFYPYTGIGVVKNAGRDAAISLAVGERKAWFGVASTGRYPYRIEVARISSDSDPDVLFSQMVEVDPNRAFTGECSLPAGTRAEQVALSLHSPSGELLLSYHEGLHPPRPIPDAAEAAPMPEDVATNEQLCLIGLHLEQYRHATFDPAAYYREALKRDSRDSRANTAMGLLLLRRGLFTECERYFRNAIERMTSRNPNPSNGDTFFCLGESLEFQGRLEEALDAYLKASWNGAIAAAAYGASARILSKRGDFAGALHYTERSLAVNGRHNRVRTHRAALLRRLGRSHEAREEANAVLRNDPLDWVALNELSLNDDRHPETESARHERFQPRKGAPHSSGLEVSVAYAHWGFWDEALEVLDRLFSEETAGPLEHYCRASLLVEVGKERDAVEEVALADSLPAGTCFPNQIEAIAWLERAGRLLPRGAKSFYYLGNLWYNNRCYERAIQAWEHSIELGAHFPTARRNLALAAYNKLHDVARARLELETAFSLDQSDARVFFELDQLYRTLGMEPSERLVRLDEHPELVERRDDLSIERVTLLNCLGRHADAFSALSRRRFHPWEGGEGRVTRQYVTALLGLTREALVAGRPDEARELAQQALHYPENLGEGKLEGSRDNDVYYYLALASRMAGNETDARTFFERACQGDTEPALSVYYNDQPAEMIYYQGLSMLAVGRRSEARGRFNRLVDYGERHRHQEMIDDYFAVSLPAFSVFEGDLSHRNRIFCDYLTALGMVGLAVSDAEDPEGAREVLVSILHDEPGHFGAWDLLRDLDRPSKLF